MPIPKQTLGIYLVELSWGGGDPGTGSVPGRDSITVEELLRGELGTGNMSDKDSIM